MNRPHAPLPTGRHLALTWGIADDYGGMTSAMLHRSRAFVRDGGVDVEVLTFDTRPDYPALESRLRDRGDFVDGMRLLNLWDWLREHVVASGEPGRLDLERQPFTPLGRDGVATTERGGATLTRTRFGADGATVLQVDHFREDGTLLLSDRRDVGSDVAGASSAADRSCCAIGMARPFARGRAAGRSTAGGSIACVRTSAPS